MCIYFRRFGVAACALAVLACDHAAWSQMTAEALVANAVSEFGPRYGDVTDAVARFHKGDVAGARGALVAAKDKRAELAPARVMLARLMLSANQIAAARTELEREVADNAGDPEAYLLFSDLALRDRRTTDAEVVLNRCAELLASFDGNPKRKENFAFAVAAGLAAVAEQREKWPAAVEHLAKWVSLDPDNAGALMRLGQAQFRAGKRDEAYKTLQAAAKAEPGLLSADIVMGRLYEDAGDAKEAAASMSQAVKVGPKELNTILAAAEWALRNNMMDVARSRAAAALKVESSSLEAQLLSGRVALLGAEFKAAEQVFAAAHLQSPANFQAANLLALALIEQDDDAKRRRALEFAELSSNLNPGSSEAAETLGWVYFRLGRTNDADRVLGTAMNTGTLSADGAYYTARLFEQVGRPEDARRLLEKSVQTKQPFAHRREAQSLLTELSPGKKPAKADDATKPDKTKGEKNEKKPLSGDKTGAADKSAGNDKKKAKE